MKTPDNDSIILESVAGGELRFTSTEGGRICVVTLRGEFIILPAEELQALWKWMAPPALLLELKDRMFWDGFTEPATHAYKESGSGFCSICDDLPGQGEHA